MIRRSSGRVQHRKFQAHSSRNRQISKNRSPLRNEGRLHQMRLDQKWHVNAFENLFGKGTGVSASNWDMHWQGGKNPDSSAYMLDIFRQTGPDGCRTINFVACENNKPIGGVTGYFHPQYNLGALFSGMMRDYQELMIEGYQRTGALREDAASIAPFLVLGFFWGDYNRPHFNREILLPDQTDTIDRERKVIWCINAAIQQFCFKNHIPGAVWINFLKNNYPIDEPLIEGGGYLDRPEFWEIFEQFGYQRFPGLNFALHDHRAYHRTANRAFEYLISIALQKALAGSIWDKEDPLRIAINPNNIHEKFRKERTHWLVMLERAVVARFPHVFMQMDNRKASRAHRQSQEKPHGPLPFSLRYAELPLVQLYDGTIYSKEILALIKARHELITAFEKKRLKLNGGPPDCKLKTELDDLLSKIDQQLGPWADLIDTELKTDEIIAWDQERAKLTAELEKETKKLCQDESRIHEIQLHLDKLNQNLNYMKNWQEKRARLIRELKDAKTDPDKTRLKREIKRLNPRLKPLDDFHHFLFLHLRKWPSFQAGCYGRELAREVFEEAASQVFQRYAKADIPPEVRQRLIQIVRDPEHIGLDANRLELNPSLRNDQHLLEDYWFNVVLKRLCNKLKRKDLKECLMAFHDVTHKRLAEPDTREDKEKWAALMALDPVHPDKLLQGELMATIQKIQALQSEFNELVEPYLKPGMNPNLFAQSLRSIRFEPQFSHRPGTATEHYADTDQALVGTGDFVAFKILETRIKDVQKPGELLDEKITERPRVEARLQQIAIPLTEHLNGYCRHQVEDLGPKHDRFNSMLATATGSIDLSKQLFPFILEWEKAEKAVEAEEKDTKAEKKDTKAEEKAKGKREQLDKLTEGIDDKDAFYELAKEVMRAKENLPDFLLNIVKLPEAEREPALQNAFDTTQRSFFVINWLVLGSGT